MPCVAGLRLRLLGVVVVLDPEDHDDDPNDDHDDDPDGDHDDDPDGDYYNDYDDYDEDDDNS